MNSAIDQRNNVNGRTPLAMQYKADKREMLIYFVN